jgi:ParB family transcriptional regulator, chromosome partitioning protein
MSIKNRLTMKTGDLVKPSESVMRTLPSEAAGDSFVEARPPRTGPGQMLAFRSHMQENDKKVHILEAQLKQYEGSLAVRMLSPKIIQPSKWANRHAINFSLPEFEVFKREIESAGGNIQPIKVRPVSGKGENYEIVFGHRRHQACLQLGIDVAAVIESVDDKELFAAMDRENRVRADLSAFEQGEMYRRALDEGLYPSLRQLSLELGVDPGNVSKAVSIARLPNDVLAAFDSPTQIQYRWGQELHVSLQRDPEGIILRAKAIRQGAKKLSAAEILNRLTGNSKSTKSTSVDIRKKGKIVGKLLRKSDGSIGITLGSGVIDDVGYKQLQLLIKTLVDAI